jgi:hypothetical protein
MLVTSHETTWCHNPKDHNLLMNLEDNENLKSHTSEKIREDLSFAAL